MIRSISVFIKDAEDHFRYLMTNTMMNKLAGRLLEGKLDEDAFPGHRGGHPQPG